MEKVKMFGRLPWAIVTLPYGVWKLACKVESVLSSYRNGY